MESESSNQKYAMFAAMIFTSMVVMYVLMYAHTYELGHVRYSDTRLYMVLIMGAAMTFVMMGFMRHMYQNRMLNLIVLGSATITLVGASWLVRSQILVGDSSYMRGMIPHHSIAILTSERSTLQDQRVRELADEILSAQRREIREMDWLLQDIRDHGEARTAEEAAARPVPQFSDAP